MRISRRGLVAFAVAVAAFGIRPAAATDCPAPTIEVRPTSAARGAAVTVTGEHWGTCDQPGGLCWFSGGNDPLHGIRLTVDRVPVGIVDADERRAFSVDVVIPPEARTGAVTIGAGVGTRTDAVTTIVVVP